MGKWIRWWGLGAFVVIAAIFVCGWYLFVDGWVEGVIEEAGTQAVGARVELDGAHLNLFPAGLVLTRLQVTDPKKPMINAVEISRVSMGLDGPNLLRRKVIVEEMAVEGLQIRTPRATSGATRDVSEDKEEPGRFSIDLPSLEIPDVKKILEQEDLETIRLIETLKADMKREREMWDSRIKELPGKTQLAHYKERVKKLKQAKKGGVEGILGGVGEVQALKHDIEQDIESLKKTKQEIEEKVKLLKIRMAQLQTAPKRDIQHLKAKYNLSPQGLANMSQTLLGEEIASWVREGTIWYERAKPFLEGAKALKGRESGPEVQKPLRGKGVDVQFKETYPLPDFLIRTTKVSVTLDMGDLAGTVHNITTNQPTLGRPTTFMLTGEQLRGVQSVSVEGTLDHVVPATAKDQLALQAKGYTLNNLAISKDDKWPVVLTRGLGDFQVNAEIVGQQLTAKGGAMLKNLQFSAGNAEDTNPLRKALTSAVTGISQLSLQTDVKGSIKQPVVSISSDLDRILKKAAGNMVNDLAAKFGEELQTAISAKIAEPMKQLETSMAGFDAIAGDLRERVTQHNGILSTLLEKTLPTKGLKLPGGLKLPF